MIVLALAALAAPVPSEGAYRNFADWASVCDNGLRCQVSSEIGQAGGVGLHLRLLREGGPNSAIELSLRSTSGLEEAASWLVIDGRAFALVREGHDLRVPPGSAATAARALAHGLSVQVVVGSRRFPLSARGSAAALRDMDARQGRAGTVTAIVARGSAPASSVPPPPPLPIRTERRPPANGPVIRPSAQRVALWRRAEGCRSEQDLGAFPVESWPIDESTAVILVMCYPGAHNSNVLVKVGTKADGSDARAAVFDHNASLSERTGPAVPPANPFRDEATGRLASGQRGGVGYPSTYQQWIWDGRRFRLIEDSGSYGSTFRARVRNH